MNRTFFKIKKVSKVILSPYLGRFKADRDKFTLMAKGLPSFLKHPLTQKAFNKKVLAMSYVDFDLTEGFYFKTLESLGYEIHLISNSSPVGRKFLKDSFGIKHFYEWLDFYSPSAPDLRAELEELLKNQNPLELSKNGIKFGKYGVSWFMRKMRSSFAEVVSSKLHPMLFGQLMDSLKAIYWSQDALDRVKPDLVCVIDRGYTPIGELYESALARGIPVLQRCGSHKSRNEILRLYNNKNSSSIHHHSLSSASWDMIQKMDWSKSHWDELYNELYHTYHSGDWFSEVGTQFNKSILTKDELAKQLNIDPKKKTVVLFPHIFWDATFFWGTDLFDDYYDWFVNVVRIAEKNTNLNWIIKVHPANVVKAKRDGYEGEFEEYKALRETIANIPSHIHLIPADSHINTFSLFSLMDYCLTVRGTIGIESASFGINTLTAGTGRYNNLGFTHDYKTKEEYLAALEKLHLMPPMKQEQVELARKFAYGIFILRPIFIDIVDNSYINDEKAKMKFDILIKTKEEFLNSSFYKTLSSFVLSGNEDYIKSPILELKKEVV